MEKTKTLVLTATLAVLAVVAIVGAAYAQTVNSQGLAPGTSGYSQVSQTGLAGPYNGAYGISGYACPGHGSYGYGAPQSGYAYGYGMGMRGGMMGGYYR